MSVLRSLVLLLVSAFVATGQTGRIELLTASPDHKRSEGARSLAGAPEISRDGKFVLYLGKTTRLGQDRSFAVSNVILSDNGQFLFYMTNRTILRFRTDTAETESIYTNGISPTVLAASADGRTLIYGPTFHAPTNAFEIWREGRPVARFANVIDGRSVAFNGETYAQLSVSADGKFALFPCTSYGPPGPMVEDRVYLCDLENLTATLVPSTGHTASFSQSSDASFSDDGSIVAFTAPLPGIDDGDKPILNVFAVGSALEHDKSSQPIAANRVREYRQRLVEVHRHGPNFRRWLENRLYLDCGGARRCGHERRVGRFRSGSQHRAA
jgi:hypothetical protein